MRYGEGLLEEIRRRTDLVQLVGRRVKLVRKGRVMWGCCPFHAEKSPSFKVENERRLYKCFGCGAGGDAFKWLMETEGLTFPEAVGKLAGEAGVELPQWSPDDEAREQKKKSLYEIVELAAAFYEAQLRETHGREARDYLKGRGLDGTAAKQFRLGYAPASGMALMGHLTSHNITQDDMIAAGLVRPAADGRPMRDFFFNRVMFPIGDGRGRIIAFGGRALEADAKPKYINSGENTLFSKGFNLYNFAGARAAAIKAGSIILAEGYMDVIALVRAGFAHAVAPLGTALTEDQLQLLWRTAPEPILAFDGDAAGQKAAHRAAHLALPHLKAGHSLRFAFLPSGEDPDSFIARSGAHAMQKLLDEALPLFDLLWRAQTEGKDFSTPERRAGLEHALRELTGQITDAKVSTYYREGFKDKVSEKFAISTPQTIKQGRFQKGWRGTAGGNFAVARMGPAVSSALRNNGLAKSTAAKLPPSAPETEKGGIMLRRPAPPIKPPNTAAEAIAARARNASAGLGARRVKEMELGALLAEAPGIALSHAEMLAELRLGDPSLDRLRHELLNLAASGSSLEKSGVQTHFAKLGMADLLAQFAGRPGSSGETAPEHDPEARFLRAVQDLREMADPPPRRASPEIYR